MGLRRLLGTLGLGAGLMYLYDPDLGRRRRSLLRDRAAHTRNRLRDGMTKANVDLQNRARGMAAQARGALNRSEDSDLTLAERARAEMGRHVSHPGAIKVDAMDGRLYLSGHVFNDELDRLIAVLARVRGVKGVVNNLSVHTSAEGVPELQGPGKPRLAQPELLQERWAPGPRLVTGVGGTMLTVYGMRQGGLPGLVLSAAGLGMAARGIANQPLRRVVGVEASRRVIDLTKTVTINAPVQEVYAMWSNFENFPRFMAHVEDVRDLGDGRSQWKVAGPAGMPVEWQALTMRKIENKVIAWKSVPGATVKSAGVVQFEPSQAGGTRLTVHMSYNPPAGAVGHAVAALFGADPKKLMDEDLMRFKSLMETGRTSQSGFEVRYDRGAGARGAGGPLTEQNDRQTFTP